MATIRNTSDNPIFTSALSGTPASNDTLYLDQWATEFTSGCSGFGAVDLARFEARKGWSGSFDADPLNIQCNQANAEFIIRSSGRVFRMTSNGGAGTIRKLIHDPSANTLLDVNSAIVTELLALNAHAVIGSSCNLATARVGKKGGAQFVYSANALTTLWMSSQRAATLERDVGTVNMLDGTLRINHTAVTPTTINGYGGTIEWWKGGNIGTLNGYKGVYDFRRAESDITIGAGFLYPDCKIIVPKRGPTIDFSLLTDYGAEVQEVNE